MYCIFGKCHVGGGKKQRSESTPKKGLCCCVNLSLTEWKNRLRWFKLVVLLGTCPMLGLSQDISKCGIISAYAVNGVLLHPRSEYSQTCLGCCHFYLHY